MIAAVTLVLCGWWFVRNAILYDGDFIGRKACAECAEKYAAIDYRPSRYPTPEKLKWTWKDILLYQDPGWNHNWLLTVLVSFGTSDDVLAHETGTWRQTVTGY